MSARLIKKIVAMAKDRHSKPVLVNMHSGRVYLGELGNVDITNGIAEIKIKDMVTHKLWTAHVDIDRIESIEPRWENAA